jgi:hypothetical protein
MKRIQIDPSDVKVVGSFRRGGPPRRRGLLAGFRLRAALVLAAAELLVVLVTNLTTAPLILGSLAVIAFHAYVGRRLRRELFRDLSWTVTLAQVLVTLIVLVVPLTVFAVTIVVVVGLLIALMLMLGKRA